MMPRIAIFTVTIALLINSCVSSKRVADDETVTLRAGLLTRTIHIGNQRLETTSLRVADHELLNGTVPEILFRVCCADPNRRPPGLKPGEGTPVQSDKTFTYYGGKPLDPNRWDDHRPEATRWTNAVTVNSECWGAWAGPSRRQIVEPKLGVRRLIIRTPLTADATFGRLMASACYETYEGYPAVRKWIEVENTGDRWVKLDQLSIDAIRLAETYRHATPMTPADQGAQSSVVGFSNADRSCGVIAASEVPSALRRIGTDGTMGYSTDWFEWVLGPKETFISEPVFLYAFAGPVEQTLLAQSTPLDRTIEGSYMKFVHEHVGIASDHAPFYAPQWLTWAVLKFNINDALMRTTADLAAKAGFAQLLFDDGWQKDRLGTEVDTAKFSDLAATSQYIRSRGLSLGLWLSCIRSDDSPDLRAVPNGRSLPPVKRMNGSAMGFSSPWKLYYAQDLARIAREVGVTYFKQDFSNVCYGDIADGHEGRTLRDSLLRGLRNLLETQDRIRAAAPQVVTELTHEIYWDTPGVPADLAVLKHVCQYHFPYNSCWGADPLWPDPAKTFRNVANQITPETHREVLRRCCFEARKRFFAQRGLPLQCLEFYAVATYSVQGSLTSDVQDRQVVSWLLGAPLTFSGDLRSLSEANLAHYRKRFDLLKRLQQQYDIYRHFQFSGVPTPTDEDWHWWGKLNDAGYGAVVVLRGSGGAERRAINVPWVAPQRRYHVTACFASTDLGVFSGQALRDGGVLLQLAPWGQEILELSPAGLPQ